MKNKFISGALALGMLATMAVPAFAEEQSSPITVDLQPTVMSVKVPTQLPIGVNADGSSSGAVTAHIQNNSAAQVEVTDVRVEAATDWTIKSWNTDWSNAALGTKEFAFKVNGNEVATDGSVDAELGVINGSGDKLAFTYEGRIAPQDGTGVVTLGNVVFTLGWVENSGLITFTIADTTYEAEAGMTWGDFRRSGLSEAQNSPVTTMSPPLEYITDDLIVYNHGGFRILYNGNPVTYGDEIIAGGVYVSESNKY